MRGRDARQVVAFTDFADARSPALFRTAYLLLGDHQLAQDLLQEALLKTYTPGRACASSPALRLTPAGAWSPPRSAGGAGGRSTSDRRRVT